jgi:hypothetical protein
VVRHLDAKIAEKSHELGGTDPQYLRQLENADIAFGQESHPFIRFRPLRLPDGETALPGGGV